MLVVLAVKMIFLQSNHQFIYSHKSPDIRDVKRFFLHIGYTGKIEKKQLAFLISIFGVSGLQQIVNHTKGANVMRNFVP